MTRTMPPLTAEQFQRRLDRLGLSQRQFGKIVQVHTQTINRWANGHLAVPHWVRLVTDYMAKDPAYARDDAA